MLCRTGERYHLVLEAVRTQYVTDIMNMYIYIDPFIETSCCGSSSAAVICSRPACLWPDNRQAPGDFIKMSQASEKCVKQEHGSFLIGLSMLSWLQIVCNVQTLLSCHGSGSNVVHFLYLTPAMIKLFVVMDS